MEDAPEIDSKIDSEQGVEATQEASEAEPAAAEDSADPGPEEPEEAIGPMKPSGPVLSDSQVALLYPWKLRWNPNTWVWPKSLKRFETAILGFHVDL